MQNASLYTILDSTQVLRGGLGVRKETHVSSRLVSPSLAVQCGMTPTSARAQTRYSVPTRIIGVDWRGTQRRRRHSSLL
jgi:hypothetical protein